MGKEILIEFVRAVRNSTISRLEKIPAGFENWSPSSGSLSVVNIAKHIIDLDYWTFEKLKDPSLKSIETQTANITIESRFEYEDMIEKLNELAEEKIGLIESMSEEELQRKMFDDRFDSEVTVEWIFLRGNLDHEIHHRGQLAAYLRLIQDGMK